MLVSLTKAGCCKEILPVKEHGFVPANVLGPPFQEISDNKDILNQSMIYREVTEAKWGRTTLQETTHGIFTKQV